MQPRITKVGHVGLTVQDIDRTVEFYAKYLGMKLSDHFAYEEVRLGHGVAVQAGAFIRCDTTHHELSLFKLRNDIEPLDTPKGSYRYGLHHIAFELASPEDLKQLYRNMRDGGVEIVNCRKGGPGNQPRFYARDPDGNLLEFYWGIDQIGWDGIPRKYDPIEEIELLDFDFDAYVEQRRKDAAEVKGTIKTGQR